MNTTKNTIIPLCKKTVLIPAAAIWFNDKWGVPVDAYQESMTNAITSSNCVPSWYVVLNDANEIIAGIGIIDNDFHKSPHLTPNLCALYVEKPYRNRGIARMLLDNACDDLASCGIKDAYLITSHTEFYEKCGWQFHCMVSENDGGTARMYHRSCYK